MGRLNTCAALLLAASAVLALSACSGGGSDATPTATIGQDTPTPQPPATPPCEGERRLTLSRPEGANYRGGSLERTSLIEPGVTGTKLTITGTVLSTACRSVAGAVLDFWQADENGAYDASGTRLRGRQTIGEDGRFRLETILPGAEPGRAPTVHVKVLAPGSELLTTQLFFAGNAANAADADYDDSLAMDVQVEGGEKVGGYDFVLKTPER